MKYKSHHFINVLLYVIKKHSGIKKNFGEDLFRSNFLTRKKFSRGFVLLFTIYNKKSKY